MMSRLKQAMDDLDIHSTSMVQTLVRWCDQNSWSGDCDRLQEMAAMLQTDFATLNLRHERIELPAWSELLENGSSIQRTTGPGLLWHHRPECKRRVLLLIHYDTVYPIGSEPSRAVIAEQNRLVGPGVADAKGGIAVIFFAMQVILAHDLANDLGITIALNPDEEIGSLASSVMLAQLAPQFDFALVFEPTLPDGAFVANRKGTGNFTAFIRGRSAHAGRNLSEGRNAIVHASRLAVELDAWNQTPGIIVNVGKLNGGGPLNQVPSVATMSFNVRVDSDEAVGEVLSRIKALEHQYTLDGFHCDIQGQFHSPPKAIDRKDAFVNIKHRVSCAMQKANRPLAWRDTGGACDGNKLAAMGLPNIDTMGPTGGNLHSPTEYCEIDSLAAAARTLVHHISDANNE